MRLIASLLACTLALAPATALAQRGTSGLPDNPGNPIADLQRQIDELRALVNALAGTPTAITVDCGLGQTIGATLAAYGGPLTITVVGTCTENVVIPRDDVVLQGAPGAGVTAASSATPVIRLDGARRVRISGLTLTGGDSGVQGSRGSSFDLSNCTVQGGARFGVLVSNSSVGTVDACLVAGSAGQGVVAANESAVYVTNSTVENHPTQGIAATRNSHARVGQDINGSNVVKPVVVRNNGQNGILIADSSSGVVVGGTVENNGSAGIFSGRSSNASIGAGLFGLTAGPTVQNNARDGIVVESSQATIVASTITGNRVGVFVHNGAGARIGITDGSTAYAGNTITANRSVGIQVNGGSSAYIGGTTVSANGTDPAAVFGRHGIAVFAASINLAGGNQILNNPAAGIFVARNAAALIGDPNFGTLPVTGAFANVISGNGATDPATKAGVFAFEGGAAEVRDAVIAGNYGAGVQALQGGQLDIRRTQISGTINQQTQPNQLFDFNGGHGVVAGLQSTVRLRGTTSISANQGAGVRLFNGTGADFRFETVAPTVNGNGLVNLDCGGLESSVSGDLSNVAGGIGSCSGF